MLRNYAVSYRKPQTGSFANFFGGEIGVKNSIDPAVTALSAVQAVKELKDSIGLNETLKDFGLKPDPDCLNALVDLAAGDGQISYNPRYVEESDLYELFKKAM